MAPGRLHSTTRRRDGSGYTAYDSTDRRLPDRPDRQRLQDRERHLELRVRVSTCTRSRATAPCVEAGGYTSYSEALRAGQGRARYPRAGQHPGRHRLPDRRRGQHRQRLQAFPDTALSARQLRRRAALPDGDEPRRHYKAAGVDDLQHRLRARHEHGSAPPATTGRGSPRRPRTSPAARSPRSAIPRTGRLHSTAKVRSATYTENTRCTTRPMLHESPAIYSDDTVETSRRQGASTTSRAGGT